MANHTGMEINTSTTKLRNGTWQTGLPLLSISLQTIERVTSYKLLGVHTDPSGPSILTISSQRQQPGYISYNNSKELVCQTVTYFTST